MKLWILLLLAAAPSPAAVLRGTVMSNDGEPLSQTAVTLHPLQGASDSSSVIKTDHFGNFEFSVTAGWYLLSASRPSFVPAQYGQKRWNSAGKPIQVEENATVSLSITMHKYGAITGRVVDENGVGIPNHEVIAYTDTQPPVIATKGVADDYGRYRIYGLSQGVYLVRSGAQRIDTASYIPTFAASTQEVMQARRANVLIDGETSGIDVRPDQGKLFDVTVVAGIPGPCGPVHIVLASDLGRQMRDTPSATFDPVPAGDYELYGNAPCPPVIPPPMDPVEMVGGYLRPAITKDVQIGLPMDHVRRTGVNYYQGSFSQVARGSNLHLKARTIDLAGTGGIQDLGNAPRAPLLGAGRWDLLLQPDAGMAVTGFGASPFSRYAPRQTRPDAWNEIMVSAGGSHLSVNFTLSNNAGGLQGVVNSGPNETVMGAPVYLESYDSIAKKRLTDLRVTTSDVHGNYHFDGLAPGTYRVLATFEYASPDVGIMDAAEAMVVRITMSNQLTKDLPLYVLP